MRRDPLGDEQAAVDARQADRVDAEVAQAGDELAVDDAAQDRGRDLERLGVGDPQPALELARDAEALEPLGDPLAAAVDEHDRPAPGDDRDLARGPAPGRRSSDPPSLMTRTSLMSCTRSSRARTSR